MNRYLKLLPLPNQTLSFRKDTRFIYSLGSEHFRSLTLRERHFAVAFRPLIGTIQDENPLIFEGQDLDGKKLFPSSWMPEFVLSELEKEQRETSLLPRPLVSIVVSCYTMERYEDLICLFRSIESQSIKPELIVVVEKDRDLRNAVYTRLQSSTLNWVLIYNESRLGLSNARNLGMRHSIGQFVGFVDDDAILFEDWTNRAIESFRKNPEIIGVTGLVLPNWEDPASASFPKSLYWIIGCTDWRVSNKEELGASVAGVNMIFRRELFDLVKFADEFTDGAQQQGKMGLPNEDNDFSIRAVLATNRRILFTPKLRVYHRVHPFKLTRKYIRRYSFWQGFAEARYNEMYKVRFRNNSRRNVLSSLIGDLSPTRPDALRRVSTILIFLSFGILGFLTFKSPRILKRITKML